MKNTLTLNERDALFYLIFLYMRLGKMDDAQMILEQLALACPEEARTGKYLASIALEREDGAGALGHLKPFLDRSEISSPDAPLLLMQAKALWLLGQEEESRRVLDEYLMFTGDES
ncbi:MAG: hypothetical protein MI747_04115 [Desulfobacterales bacterium]|nr:hypothetical protein [Desulfobacterales bacterium]